MATSKAVQWAARSRTPASFERDGDQLRMRVVGDTISAFHKRASGDWVQIARTTDGTFRDGQPGLGFFVRDEGQSIQNIGVKDYSVREIP
jgi:hypothetical protein